MTELALIPIAFFTSALAAVMGMGGGILLIALMPGLIPAAAIIPVHGCTQLASNLSRAAFGWKEIDFRIILPFSVGAIAGAWLGGEIYAGLNLHWLPALIGFFVLVYTWVPLPGLPGGGPLTLSILGFYQTGLGMLAGATGPLGAAVLMRRNSGRDSLVVNTAVYMSVNHVARVCAFVLMGFSLAPWWQLVTAMILAVIAGSWVGTRLRSGVPQVEFQRWFKWLVTVLAVRMIALPLL